MLAILQKHLIAGLGALALTAGAQAAAIINLENPGSDVFKQTDNSPCIYDNSSCSNGGFPSTLIPSLGGPSNDYEDLMSPEYMVSQITSTLSSQTFFIGIDVNTQGNQPAGGGPELLELFEMYVDTGGGFVLVAEFTTPTLLKLNKNAGNGESDDLLTSTAFDLSGYAPTDLIKFNMTLRNDVSGREQFFLISTQATPEPVPEPATWLLFGAGLVALGRRWRRRSA